MGISSINPFSIGNIERGYGASTYKPISKPLSENKFGSVSRPINTNTTNGQTRIIPTTEDMEIAQELWNFKATNPIEEDDRQSSQIFNKFQEDDGEIHPNIGQICIA